MWQITHPSAQVPPALRAVFGDQREEEMPPAEVGQGELGEIGVVQPAEPDLDPPLLVAHFFHHPLAANTRSMAARPVRNSSPSIATRLGAPSVFTQCCPSPRGSPSSSYRSYRWPGKHQSARSPVAVPWQAKQPPSHSSGRRQTGQASSRRTNKGYPFPAGHQRPSPRRSSSTGGSW